MNQSYVRPVKRLKMTVRTSVLWKMNMHMAKKWTERVVKRSFIKEHSFGIRVYIPYIVIILHHRDLEARSSLDLYDWMQWNNIWLLPGLHLILGVIQLWYVPYWFWIPQNSEQHSKVFLCLRLWLHRNDRIDFKGGHPLFKLLICFWPPSIAVKIR